MGLRLFDDVDNFDLFAPRKGYEPVTHSHHGEPQTSTSREWVAVISALFQKGWLGVTEEIWRPVVGYGGRYLISTSGRVWSARKRGYLE